MAGLSHTLAAMGGDGVRLVYGTAFWDGTEWLAVVGGNQLAARWLDPIQPLQGGKVVVAIIKDDYGQSTALVLGGYTDQPRPSTGTVTAIIPAGVATQIAFTGEDGKPYVAERFIGSYATGDMIYLSWDAATPTVIGKIPTVTVTPPAPTPLAPGGGDVTGTQRTPASASDTFWAPGGWGSYATSVRGGEDVYSGSYYSGPVTGAWFYGPANTVLAGKTIKQARFRLPQRLNAGSYNSPATIHLYAHNSQSRPGGDVSRVVGPFDVTIPGGAPPSWVTLPTSFHAVLVAGGGISISGDPYVGFQSRLKDPDSGKLEIDWSN